MKKSTSTLLAIIHKRFLTCLFILFGVIACQKYESISDKKDVVSYAQEHLVSQGTLMQKKDGFVYLKLDNAYVTELYSFIQEPGCHLTSAFYRYGSIGAHISVIYANEKSTDSIKELGQIFTFIPKKIKRVKTRKYENIILQVESPELMRLRESYGLSPKLNHHEFHITICQKRL
jgi:hypothetical protein